MNKIVIKTFKFYLKVSKTTDKQLTKNLNSCNFLDKAIENNGFGVNLCLMADGTAMKQEM